MFGSQRSSQGAQGIKYRGQNFKTQLSLNLTDTLKPKKQTLTINGRKIRLTTPAGLENGKTIKITGHEASGLNGELNVDLNITFTIKNNTSEKGDNFKKPSI
jgi:curved DNA-binding protein